MKLKFCYDELGLLDVHAEGKAEIVGWVLTDNNHNVTIDELLKNTSEIKEHGGDWNVSFNKSYVSITSTRVRCGYLYQENEFVDLDPRQFTELLRRWRAFIAREGIDQEEVVEISQS